MKIKFLLWYVFFSLWLMGCRDAESAIDYKQNVSVRLSWMQPLRVEFLHFRQSTESSALCFGNL